MAASMYRVVAALAGLAFAAVIALVFSAGGTNHATVLISDVDRQKQIAQIDQWEST
jgi:hypothetical protein